MAQALLCAIILVWFGFGLLKIHFLRPLLNYPVQVNLFYSKYVTLGQKLCKAMVLLYLLFQSGLVWFWICSNEISKGTIEVYSLICILFGTKIVTLGHELAETMVLAIFMD